MNNFQYAAFGFYTHLQNIHDGIEDVETYIHNIGWV
jgi:hypothetical protein